MSRAVGSRPETSDDIVEQIVTVPESRITSSDNPTPITSMTGIINHLNQPNQYPAPQTARPFPSNHTFGRQPRNNSRRGPQIYNQQNFGINRSSTDPVASQYATYGSVPVPPMPQLRNNFQYPPLQSAFTFNLNPPRFTDRLSEYQGTESFEDAYDRSRGAFFSKPGAKLPPILHTTTPAVPAINPTTTEPEANATRESSMQLLAPTTGVAKVVERANIQSTQGSISGPIWPASSRGHPSASTTGSSHATVIEEVLTNQDVDKVAEEINNQASKTTTFRPVSRHIRTTSTPARVESGMFSPAPPLPATSTTTSPSTSPALLASVPVPRPLFTSPHRNVDNQTSSARRTAGASYTPVPAPTACANEKIDALERRLDVVRVELLAGIDRLERKLDRVLSVVDGRPGPVITRAERGQRGGGGRGGGGGGGGGGGAAGGSGKAREIRGNLVGMPPHIPFGGLGLEGWYEEVKGQ